jgi:hypothetical protein
LKVCPALSQRMSWRTSSIRLGIRSKRWILGMTSSVSASSVGGHGDRAALAGRNLVELFG